MRRREWVFEVADVERAMASLRAVNAGLEPLAGGRDWWLLDDPDGPVWFAIGNGRVVMRGMPGRHLRPGEAELIDAYIAALRAE